jgi:hypothetical protein
LRFCPQKLLDNIAVRLSLGFNPPDPEKNRRRGRPKALASRHGCRSSVDLAGRTRKIKISAQEFSLQLGAPNLRSKLMKSGVRVCLGTQIAK